MNKATWLACTDPHPMLEFLLRRPLATMTKRQPIATLAMNLRSGWGRKFRLYACGWARHFWNSMTDERLRNALEVMEHHADGRIGDDLFQEAKRQAKAAYQQALESEGTPGWGTNVAAFMVDVMSLRFLPGWDPRTERETETGNEESESSSRDLSRFQCCLLRELFGPLPFEPVVVAPDILTWNEGIIYRMAQTTYSDQTFDQLPIMGDALEEAGCSNIDILDHCRQTGEHARGCWVVDLLLGK